MAGLDWCEQQGVVGSVKNGNYEDSSVWEKHHLPTLGAYFGLILAFWSSHSGSAFRVFCCGPKSRLQVSNALKVRIDCTKEKKPLTDSSKFPCLYSPLRLKGSHPGKPAGTSEWGTPQHPLLELPWLTRAISPCSKCVKLCSHHLKLWDSWILESAQIKLSTLMDFPVTSLPHSPPRHLYSLQHFCWSRLGNFICF